MFIGKTANVTHGLNIDRSVVNLALITKKASLPRLTASVITTLGGGPRVTVKGMVNDGLFGVFFMLKYDTDVAPLRLDKVAGFSLLALINSYVLL